MPRAINKKNKFDILNLPILFACLNKDGTHPITNPINTKFISFGYAFNKQFKTLPTIIIPIIIPILNGNNSLILFLKFLNKFKTQSISFS